MSGKVLGALFSVLFLVALVLQAGKARDRWIASFHLAQVETLVIRLQAEGHLGKASSQRVVRRALDKGLEILRDAEALDPAEVEIPVAQGVIYNLLQRPSAAIRAYERAQKLEPRPETFANLGRVYLREGEREKAREAFRSAAALDHTLVRELRPYLPERNRKDERTKPRPDGKNKKNRRKNRRGDPASRAATGPWEEVFSDSFESGDLSRWTGSSRDRQEERERDE